MGDVIFDVFGGGVWLGGDGDGDVYGDFGIFVFGYGGVVEDVL